MVYATRETLGYALIQKDGQYLDKCAKPTVYIRKAHIALDLDEAIHLLDIYPHCSIVKIVKYSTIMGERL